jgi:hypothetical protein
MALAVLRAHPQMRRFLTAGTTPHLGDLAIKEHVTCVDSGVIQPMHVTSWGLGIPTQITSGPYQHGRN